MIDTFKTQGEEFKADFEKFVKETLGDEYFTFVKESSTLGILSFSVSLYKGDIEEYKNSNVYYLNAPHIMWHIQTGEYKYFNSERIFKRYSPICAEVLRSRLAHKKPRKISVKDKGENKAEPKKIFEKIKIWIEKNKEEIFE